MSVTAASNMDVPWRTWPKFSKYTDDRMCRPSSERNEWPVRVCSFRQLLNIAHALKRTARGSGSEAIRTAHQSEAFACESKLVMCCSSLPSLRQAVDWVIHLDHDELFLPPPQGLQAFPLHVAACASRGVVGKQAHLRHLDTSDCRLDPLLLVDSCNFLIAGTFPRSLPIPEL